MIIESHFPYIVALLGLFVGSGINAFAARIPKAMERDWFQEVVDGLPELPLTFSDPLEGHRFWRGNALLNRLTTADRESNHNLLVELLTSSFSVLVALEFGFTAYTFSILVFSYMVILAVVIDINEMILPDRVTIPLVWLGLLNAILFPAELSVTNAVLGAVCGYCLLWCLNAFNQKLRGNKLLGNGDFKLLAAIGAWLGWYPLFTVVFIAALLLIAQGIVRSFFADDENKPLFPFGPMLAIGCFVSLLSDLSIF